jgi:hypothetical protein
MSCVCRALDRENLMTAAQAIKQQIRLRYPKYYARPVPSPANASVSGTSDPEGLPELLSHVGTAADWARRPRRSAASDIRAGASADHSSGGRDAARQRWCSSAERTPAPSGHRRSAVAAASAEHASRVVSGARQSRAPRRHPGPRRRAAGPRRFVGSRREIRYVRAGTALQGRHGDSDRQPSASSRNRLMTIGVTP